MNSLITHLGGWHPGLIVVLALIAGTAIGGFLRRPFRGTLVALGLVILFFLFLPGQRAGWQIAWGQEGWGSRAQCLGDVLTTGAIWNPSTASWEPGLESIQAPTRACAK